MESVLDVWKVLSGKQMLLAAHPIGSLVNLAEGATEFPKMGAFVR